MPKAHKITGIYQPQQSLSVEKSAQERKHAKEERHLLMGHVLQQAKDTPTWRLLQLIGVMEQLRTSGMASSLEYCLRGINDLEGGCCIEEELEERKVDDIWKQYDNGRKLPQDDKEQPGELQKIEQSYEITREEQQAECREAHEKQCQEINLSQDDEMPAEGFPNTYIEDHYVAEEEQQEEKHSTYMYTGKSEKEHAWTNEEVSEMLKHLGHPSVWSSRFPECYVFNHLN